MRMRIHFGLDKAKAMMCEQPLKRWIHADGSKLSMKDSIKIIMQLGQIAWVYRSTSKNLVENTQVELKLVQES